jgi:hypothetical protein
MSDLTPVAFDIETSGLGEGAVLTVAGFAFDLGCWLGLNTAGRAADGEALADELEARTGTHVRVAVRDDETALLRAVARVADDKLDTDRHYLTAYNGETWNGGFDLPFLRRACVRHEIAWPFTDLAYADTMPMVDRFDTGDQRDLCGVYDALVGGEHCDPFEDSGAAVTAFEDGDWADLLAHNLADIQRTRDLALLAERYVPQSDFGMKNLAPPSESR